jgi:hypothetical protein
MLGFMAFVPRPVESSSGEKGGESPPNTSLFTPDNEGRPPSFYSIDSRTGLVAYENQDVTVEEWLPPDRMQGPANGIHQGAVSTELPPFRDPTPSPGSTYSRASTGTNMGNSAFVQNIPKQSPISPGMVHGVPLLSTPTPHVPPAILAPGAVRLRNYGTTLGLQAPSTTYKAPSTTWGSDVTLRRNVTEPSRTVQRHRVVSGRRSYIPPVPQSFWSQSAGDVPVLGQSQWQRLVLTAAAKS